VKTTDHIVNYSTQETLDKYGLKANDAILADPKTNHLELYDDLLNNYKANLLSGGAAQNSARGAQVRGKTREDRRADSGSV